MGSCGGPRTPLPRRQGPIVESLLAVQECGDDAVSDCGLGPDADAAAAGRTARPRVTLESFTGGKTRLAAPDAVTVDSPYVASTLPSIADAARSAVRRGRRRGLRPRHPRQARPQWRPGVRDAAPRPERRRGHQGGRLRRRRAGSIGRRLHRHRRHRNGVLVSTASTTSGRAPTSPIRAIGSVTAEDLAEVPLRTASSPRRPTPRRPVPSPRARSPSSGARPGPGRWPASRSAIR